MQLTFSITPTLRPLRDGFTLLELLVVLTLIGVLVGLALPNFSKMLDSFAVATQWRELEGELEALPLRAFSEGRAISLTNTSAPVILKALPLGWQINVSGSIRYHANGWCEGGRLAVIAGTQGRRDYELIAPRCVLRSP